MKDRKIWNINRNDLTDRVYRDSVNAGYPKHFFSSHSFRSGVVCQMLLNSLNGDVNRFNQVFNDARTLGEWTENSTASTIIY